VVTALREALRDSVTRSSNRPRDRRGVRRSLRAAGGAVRTDDLHWEVAAEKLISSVIDVLIERFAARPGRTALVGLSLGGYFLARAAGYETRLSTVIASTPFPNPAQLFALSVHAAMDAADPVPSTAAVRSRQITLWKAGATTAREFLTRSAERPDFCDVA
jgi:hypothetical protein